LIQPATRAAAQAAAADPQSESVGRAHFEAGRDAFSDGRFGAALDEFKQAYELTHRPALLYNIGTSADRLRHDREALEAFELYLVKVPTPPNLAEIQGRIAVLRETVSRQEPAKQPASTSPAEPARRTPETNLKPVLAASMLVDGTATTPTAPELVLSGAAQATPKTVPTPAQVARAAQHEDTHSSVAPWVVIGVSAGAMVAGGVLLAVAATRLYKVEHAEKGTTLPQIQGAHDSVPALSIAGFVSLGVGAAGAAAGLTWKLLPDNDKKTPGTTATTATTAQLRLVPGGASLSGKF
jgi:hypothetical protein